MYCLTCQLKNTKIFAVFLKDLEFEAKKKARPKTNWKTVVLKEYHNFLDVFSKKNSDTLSLYWKYNYKTILERE